MMRLTCSGQKQVASEKGESAPGKSEVDFDIEDTSEHIQKLLKSGTGLAAALEQATFDTSLSVPASHAASPNRFRARLKVQQPWCGLTYAWLTFLLTLGQ